MLSDIFLGVLLNEKANYPIYIFVIVFLMHNTMSEFLLPLPMLLLIILCQTRVDDIKGFCYISELRTNT